MIPTALAQEYGMTGTVTKTETEKDIMAKTALPTTPTAKTQAVTGTMSLAVVEVVILSAVRLRHPVTVTTGPRVTQLLHRRSDVLILLPWG